MECGRWLSVKGVFQSAGSALGEFGEDKLNGELLPVGSKAGEITEAVAAMTGLNAGTAVAVANLDAHVTGVGVGMTKSGQMMAIMGTSTCHMLISDKDRDVPGMCGAVKDGYPAGIYRLRSRTELCRRSLSVGG